MGSVLQGGRYRLQSLLGFSDLSSVWLGRTRSASDGGEASNEGQKQQKQHVVIKVSGDQGGAERGLHVSEISDQA